MGVTHGRNRTQDPLFAFLLARTNPYSYVGIQLEGFPYQLSEWSASGLNSLLWIVSMRFMSKGLFLMACCFILFCKLLRAEQATWKYSK